MVSLASAMAKPPGRLTSATYAAFGHPKMNAIVHSGELSGLGLRERLARRQRSAMICFGKMRTKISVEGGAVGMQPGISDEVSRILAVLPSATILVRADLSVVRVSSRAMAMGMVNRERIAINEIGDVVAQVATDGVARESEIRVKRPPLQRDWMELRVRVAALDDATYLVLVDDLSEERRVEAVRRDFVANVSHELKTPVGAMSLLAEAIQSASDDAEQVQHFARRMQSEAARLTNLIQDVIELSRLQGEESLTDAEPLLVDDLVRVAVDEQRTAASASGITIVVGGDTDAMVFGDSGQLLTALRNLLSNALHYSESNTQVAVVVTLGDDSVEVSVKDQGRGIAPGDLDRVFERFYRVDQARSRATGGTGLGLAIVKHIAANHGGDVRVWSELGEGSTFTLRLPVMTATPETVFSRREGVTS